MDAFLAIVSKREVRQYDGRSLSADATDRILHAGRVAGSAGNRQPWRFVVVEARGRRERLAELVDVPANVRSAGLVVGIAVRGGRWGEFDAGRAAQNMMLTAWNDGVGSCPNGMTDAAGAAEVLGLEGDERLVVVLSFGYPATARDPQRRPAEEWLARAKRKPLEEVVRRV